MGRRDPASTPATQAASSWWKKLAWLVAIWTASVLALAAVAGLLRLAMQAVGLSR